MRCLSSWISPFFYGLSPPLSHYFHSWIGILACEHCLPSSCSFVKQYVDIVLSWNSFLSPVLATIFIFFCFVRWIIFFQFHRMNTSIIRLYIIYGLSLFYPLESPRLMGDLADFSSYISTKSKKKKKFNLLLLCIHRIHLLFFSIVFSLREIFF